MLKNEQNALLLHKENYNVPKGQEHLVHYKIAKQTPSGDFQEKVRLVLTGVKTFDGSVKRNLELQGYLVEILYHPKGTYSNVVIIDKDNALAEMRRKLAELEGKANEDTNAIAEEANRRLKEELKAKAEEIKKLKEQLKEKKGGKE